MNLLNRFRTRNYGYGSIVQEIIPVFHDRFKISNKTHKVFDKNDPLVNKLTMETQNGKKVQFHKEFEMNGEFIGCLEFSRDEIRPGLIYRSAGTGFLENGNSLSEVILVTDKFIYSKDIDSDFINILSHDEVERMKSMNGFIVEY